MVFDLAQIPRPAYYFFCRANTKFAKHLHISKFGTAFCDCMSIYKKAYQFVNWLLVFIGLGKEKNKKKCAQDDESTNGSVFLVQILMFRSQNRRDFYVVTPAASIHIHTFLQSRITNVFIIAKKIFLLFIKYFGFISRRHNIVANHTHTHTATWAWAHVCVWSAVHAYAQKP